MQESDGKMLFTNNSRKMAGIPLRRKKDKRKRVYTRNRAEEDTEALIDWLNGRWEADNAGNIIPCKEDR